MCNENTFSKREREREFIPCYIPLEKINADFFPRFLGMLMWLYRAHITISDDVDTRASSICTDHLLCERMSLFHSYRKTIQLMHISCQVQHVIYFISFFSILFFVVKKKDILCSEHGIF